MSEGFCFGSCFLCLNCVIAVPRRVLRVMDPDKSGDIDLSEFSELLSPVLEKLVAKKHKAKGLWKSAAIVGRATSPRSEAQA